MLAIRFDWRNTSLLTLHNFSCAKQHVKIKVDGPNDKLLVEVFDGRHSSAHNDGSHRVAMDGYAWRWFRVGAPDSDDDAHNDISELVAHEHRVR